MLASPATRRPESLADLISPQLCAALDQLDFSSTRLFSGKLQGERRSKSRGRSVEFEDYRQYVAGDDLRHIDWNVLARLDRFFIKIFQEEQDLALHLVLDASASMDAGNPNKLLFAQRLAMALGYLGLVNNNRVMMTIFGAAEIHRLEPIRSSRNVQRLARFLIDKTFSSPQSQSQAPSQTTAPVSFTSALKVIAAARSGRGILVLLSDLLIPEGYREGLGTLAALAASGFGPGGWDATIIQTLAPGELDPLTELDGSNDRVLLGDLRLTDAESGRACEVTITADLVKRYLARLDAYQRDLHAFAVARGMSHIVTPTSTDIPALILGDLRRTGMVK